MLIRQAFIKVFVIATVAILAWQTNAQAQIVKEGLVHYWTLDKDSIKDKVVEDAIGDNKGEIKGDPETVEGNIGEALKFDGVDDYISLTPVDVIVNHSFTIQVWVNLTQHAYNIAVSQGDAHSTNHYLHFGTHTDTHAFMFRFYGDDQDGGKLELNKWYHLVGVYDKDKPEARLYVNGDDVANKAGSGGLKSNVANSDFEIGANYGRLGRANWFHGIIDEVGIYDRALSAEEVKQNYNAEKGLYSNVNSAGKLSLTWGQIKASR